MGRLQVGTEDLEGDRMIPVEERRRRLVFARNRSCLLFGVSWSHYPSFGARKTHFYLGAWTLTLTTAA